MIAKYGSLAVFLMIVIMVAAISGMFHAGEWWFLIAGKPSWVSPDWVFGPAWAVAYLLMALAAWRVWQTEHNARQGALIWWGIALFLMILWHILFLGFHRVGWSWLFLGVNLGVTVLNFRAFYLLSREAALMLLPFLIWIGYLWAVNFYIWTMNGGYFGKWLA